MDHSAMRTAIIGAGFSGTLMAIHLLRRAAGGDRVYVFERSLGFGRGVAYATTNASHLLNVPAGTMGAEEDDPQGFLRWLDRAASTDECPLARPVSPAAFVPRGLYGRYLQEHLRETLSGRGKGRHLFPVTDEVVDIEKTAGGLIVETWSGRSFLADRVVLALGNLPPDENRPPHYFGDPWDEAATQGLDPRADVLVLGTSLTMVDVVLSLLDRGHGGRIYAASRRGLLPRAHAPRLEQRPWPLRMPRTRSSRALLRAVRAEVGRAAGLGRPWHDVIDALRPHLQAIWRDLPCEERQRFLRHIRPWWDVHRHRMPPQVAARIQHAARDGQLTVVAGQVEQLSPRAAGVEAQIRPRGAATVEKLQVARVINCSGPQTDLARCGQKLVRNLLARGYVRADPLRLGLDTSGDCALIDGHGRASGRLFAVGPLTRGTFGEITAVPEIRGQCAGLARQLSEQAQWPRPIAL